jgi:hypothetical protein
MISDPYDPPKLFDPEDIFDANILDMLAEYLTKTEEEKKTARSQLHTALKQEYTLTKEQDASIVETLNGTRNPDINFAYHAQKVLRSAREQLELYPLKAFTFKDKDHILDTSFPKMYASSEFVGKITGYAYSAIYGWETGML